MIEAPQNQANMSSSSRWAVSRYRTLSADTRNDMATVKVTAITTPGKNSRFCRPKELLPE